MEVKIDEKLVGEELAKLLYESLAGHLADKSKDHWYMFYDKDIANAVQRNIDKLFEENKDYIFNAVVEKCAERFHKDIQLQVILSAMMGDRK